MVVAGADAGSPPPIRLTPQRTMTLMGAMVLLRHELPDESAHFDWLLQRDGAVAGGTEGRPGLISFRVSQRPDQGAVGELVGLRLPDHRDVYLTYEGPVSGAPLAPGAPSGSLADRGRITRVAAGACRVLSDQPDRLEFEARFEGGPARRWSARPHLGGSGSQENAWSFFLVETPEGAILKEAPRQGAPPPQARHA